MSEFSAIINSFESKIIGLEQSLAQAADQVKQWSDKHNGIFGMLQATKEALADVKKIYSSSEPDSDKES